MLGTLKNFWTQLTRPHPSIEDIERRRQSRLLASIALLILLLQLFSLPLVFGYSPTELLSYMVGTSVGLSAYFLNRSGRYLLPAHVIVFATFVMAHAALFTPVDALIFYAIPVLIISGIFLSLRTTFILFSGSVILQIIFVMYTPGQLMLTGFDVLLFFIFTISVLFLYFFHRSGLENERQEELKAANLALQQSEARWRSLVSAAPDFIMVLERDLTLSYINQLAPGMECGQLIGQSLNHFLLPEDRDKVINLLENALSSGKPVRFESQVIAKDNVKHWFSVIANAFSVVDEPPQLIVIGRNITASKEAERLLREERNLLRSLIDSLPDSIYVKDVEGKFLLANKASISQVKVSKAEDLIGKTDFEFFPHELASEFRKNEEVTIASGKKYMNFEEPLLNLKDGTEGRVFTTIVPIKNSEGQVNRIVGVSRDITAIKDAEKQQLELSIHKERVKVLEEVVSDLSHDIKTPLASIKTSVYMLGRQPERQRDYLDKLNHQVDHLTGLVEDILAMARLDKSTRLSIQSLTIKRFGQIIQEIISDNQHRLDEKKLSLSENLSDSTVSIIINLTELRRAVANLIENAITYTPEGGSIEVKSSLEDNELIISISDTGIGITEADQSRIYDRFYRADKARSTDEAGTGLGLAITRRIVDLHGGRIELESTVDEGSHFSIHIPILTQTST